MMILLNRIIRFVKNLICRFTDDDVLALGTQLAYSLLLSFFPFLIFLISALGFSSLSSDDVLTGFGSIVPDDTYDLVKKTVSEVIDTQNTQILSFSLIFTIIAASGGFNAIIKGLNKAYDEVESRSFFHVQLVSIICTFLVVIVIIAAVALLVFGHIIGEIAFRWLGFGENFYFLWNFLRIFIVLLCMIVIFMSLYYYAPSRKLKWKEVLPGAVFSALVWMGASICFSLYINRFGDYSKIYGSIGAVIILLLWLFITSVVILVGGEINAALIEPCH